MTDSLYALIASRFPAERTRTVIETAEGRRYAYADLETTTARYARLFARLGAKPGDRLAAQVAKSPEAVFLYLAALRAGLAYLPLNTAYPAAEVAYFLADAEPAIVVCDPAVEAETTALAAAAGVRRVLTLDAAGEGTLAAESAGLDPDFAPLSRAADDLAAILYTSGTTGRSKGAMLSHGNLASNALTLHAAWGFEPADVLLHALPIFHTHGLFVAIHCVLLNGTAMLFLPRFDAAEVVRLLPRASVLMGVPTHYVRLLGRPELDREACRAMRLFISGSAPLRLDTFERFRERTGHTILERYGMTECGMITSNPLHGRRVAGSVGPPLPGVEARVATPEGILLPTGEVGILEVRGPNVFKGYWRNPEKTREEFRGDGFFITGDLARIDEAGYVWIVGRAKDLVISGGYNVYPKEVERVIDAIGGIAESAVIGLAHPDFGEAVTAVVVPAAGGEAVDEAAVIARVKEALANYKVPKRVFFVDALPRNAMGKVQKQALRERFADTYADT